MVESETIAGAWVEIAERCTKDEMVFLREGGDYTPTRGGRRKLDLAQQGVAKSIGLGPTDRPEPKSQGGWKLDGETLNLALEGWEGNYTVKKLTEAELVLIKSD